MVNPAMALLYGNTVSCVVAVRPLQHSTPHQSEAARSLRAVDKVSFNLEDAQELANSENKKTNAISLVTSSATVAPQMQNSFVLLSRQWLIARFEKTAISKLIWQQTISASWSMKRWKTMLRLIKRRPPIPSTVVPVTTEGTKPDLNASFVSANAEQFYQYQPTEIILSEGQLVDSPGNGVAGVDYYTNSGRGVTDETVNSPLAGGETISFGIDTLNWSSVRGNKSTIALTELGDEVRGQISISSFIVIRRLVKIILVLFRTMYARSLPNIPTINEIINLSLSNGATLDEGDQNVVLPNEFIEQFKTGQAKEIVIPRFVRKPTVATGGSLVLADNAQC